MKPFRHRVRRLLRTMRPTTPGDHELVSLDLETSNLDAKTAVILSIAAVPIRDRRVLLNERFVRTVRSEGPVDSEAVKYHRLRPVDVARGVTAAAATQQLVEWLGDRAVLGYCIGFDCAVLERVLRGSGRHRFDAERFDLRDLYAREVLRRNPHAVPARELDVILQRLGIPVAGRHTALGDAAAVGLAWIALRHGEFRSWGQAGPRR